MLSIYRASAGSGKTHTLTQEYLLLLFRELQQHRDHFLPHSRILAVTFTKKATAEFNAYSLSYKIWELGGEWNYHPEVSIFNKEHFERDTLVPRPKHLEKMQIL